MIDKSFKLKEAGALNMLYIVMYIMTICYIYCHLYHVDVIQFSSLDGLSYRYSNRITTFSSGSQKEASLLILTKY